MPFPNVYEPRPVRAAAPLTDAEKKQLESELATLRESQRQRATAPDPAPPPAQAAPAPAKSAPAKSTSAKAEVRKPAPRKPPDNAVVPEQKGPAAPLKMVN